MDTERTHPSWPDDFQPAELHGVTNTDGESIGIGFALPDGSVTRLLLPLQDAVVAAKSIIEFADAYLRKGTNSQAPRSSGTPSAEVSAQAE